MNRPKLVLVTSLVLVAVMLPMTPALAGPNTGGVLLIHANTSLVYTSDTTSYCGQSGLAACSLAVTNLPWDPESTTVFYVLAAFPDDSEPRLKAISWGVDWDDSKLVLVAHGSCADFDIPDGTWPASGTGIGQSFTETQTGLLTELYWFAGYAYGSQSDSTSFTLTPHPVQGGTVVDDESPPNEDDLVSFGELGFGEDGELPCPSILEGDGQGMGSAGGEDVPGGFEPEDSGGEYESSWNTNPRTYIELTTTSDTAFVRCARELRRVYGIGNSVGLAPDAIFCRISEEVRAAVAQDARVLTATVDSIPNAVSVLSPGEPGFSEVVWNRSFLRTEPDSGAVEPVPIDSVFYAGDSDRGYFEQYRMSDSQTSTYLLGEVGVTLILMESRDSTHCDETHFTENWNEDSPYEKADAIVEATTALHALADQAPDAGLSIDVFESPTCYTDSEPIWEPCSAAGWRMEAIVDMDSTGTGDDVSERERALANKRRMDNGYDWWFIAYIVRSTCKQDTTYDHDWGWFGPDTTVVDKYGCADLYGPRNTSCSQPHSRSLDWVLTHETCHVFGAGDEGTSLPCANYYGYLREQNLNSKLGPGCDQHVNCIMAVDWTWNLCEHTRRQIGWKDSDDDGAFDPIDHPDAENSIFIGDEETLALGDSVNIYQVAGTEETWVKRLDASNYAEDQGHVLWDGMDYRGLPVAAGSYKWRRNQGTKHDVTLGPDQERPRISELQIWKGARKDTLIIRFSDPDTHGDRIRAVLHPVPPDSDRQSLVIPNEFWVETGDSGSVRRVEFNVPQDGIWAMDLLAWDVGGGHQHAVSTSWWQGGNPPAGVGLEPLSQPELRLSPGRPNPSSNWVSWGIDRIGAGLVNVAIIRADGREVRSWPETEVVSGASRIIWDGTDNHGFRVPSGRYYLVVRDGTGKTLSRSVTVVR